MEISEELERFVITFKNHPTLRIRKTGRMKNIFNEKRNFKITKVIPLLQTKFPKEPKKVKGKLYVLQRIKFEDRKIYFRLGYYIISPKTNRWVWGQYCPIGPIEDFKKIVNMSESL